MGRIELESPERKTVAMTALSWIYYTKRPLSINELLHVLAVDPSASSLSEENILSVGLQGSCILFLDPDRFDLTVGGRQRLF
jgi:hypothetical protein